MRHVTRLRAASAVLLVSALGAGGLLARAQNRSLATVSEVTNRSGFVDVTVKGDGGGTLVIHYDLDGFYVVQLPVLSGLLERGRALPPGFDAADTTLLFPKVTRGG